MMQFSDDKLKPSRFSSLPSDFMDDSGWTPAAFAWRSGRIRPYESLLILTQRFIWLNRPTLSDIAALLSLTKRQLRRVDLVCRKGRDKVDSLAPLRQLLGMSKLVWERSLLDWRAGGNYGTFMFPTMRVCLKCLELAFHTVVFQLEETTACPIHDCELVRTCPACGEELSSDLNSEFLESAFRCLRCGREFATRRVIINPPPIPNVWRIAKLANWNGT
jgi:hypothetical protein